MVWSPFIKTFRLLWVVSKDDKISYLAGTAHFFPYSYKTSIKKILKNVHTVLFEGPLDEGNMETVRGHGIGTEDSSFFKNYLDKDTLSAIDSEINAWYYGDTLRDYLGILRLDKPSLFEREVEGLRPWMAFFKIWSGYLKRRGWRHSVDLDAYSAAKELNKEIHHLETIDEQVSALEGIPFERFIRFFSLFNKWEGFAKRHARYYMRGDLDRMLEVTNYFPTRHESIIDNRDPVLYKRMKPFMEKGGVIAFVGTTHIKGIRLLLEKDGFQVEKKT